MVNAELAIVESGINDIKNLRAYHANTIISRRDLELNFLLLITTDTNVSVVEKI